MCQLLNRFTADQKYNHIEKRTDGLGVLRVVRNLAATIRPAIGSILAVVDLLLLFLGDVIIFTTMAIIVFFALTEIKPPL